MNESKKDQINSDIQLIDGSTYPQVQSKIIPEESDLVVEVEENNFVKNEPNSEITDRNPNKNQQGGKGRRPRWKKRRPSNQNKSNDRK